MYCMDQKKKKISSSVLLDQQPPILLLSSSANVLLSPLWIYFSLWDYSFRKYFSYNYNGFSKWSGG